MYSSMQNKNKNKPISQQIKKQRPKPEWTTDFVDREQYKLSEVQRIQKKASLQSKNRQEARRQLDERRKKLQMGIIDEQTRKIYQTALLSKNIDINPPLRRNLTEMIRYEKQQKQKIDHQNENYNGSDNEEEFDEEEQSMRELKEAQNFIKKFEKAKKQKKIQRAVEILSNNKSLEKQKKTIQNKEPQTKMNNFLSDSQENNSRTNKSTSYNLKASNKSQSFSQDDALSSIEDTIRFMEEKLFAAKKSVDEHSKSFISEQNESFSKQTNSNFRLDERQITIQSKPTFKKSQKVNKQITELKFQTQNNFGYNEDLQFGTKMGQISQLKIKLKDSEDGSSDDECLDTIRRMRQLMEDKESQYEHYQTKKMKQNIRDNFSPSLGTLGFHSTISKNSIHSAINSEAEVSFNLTVNDDELQQESSILNINKNKFKPSEANFSRKELKSQVNQQKSQFNKKYDQKGKQREKEDDYEKEYQKIRQNLFSCINSQNQSSVNKIENQKNIPKAKPTLNKFNEDSDEGQQSDDSLMIQDKINIWKKELEHQVDPDEDSQDSRQNINFKTTAFTKKIHQTSSRGIVKQNQEEEQEEDQEPYRYNYLSDQKNQNQKYIKQNNYQEQWTNKESNESYPDKLGMKKPPLAKKSQNNEKFEEMKKMISDASTQIKNIQIQPLKIESFGGGEVLGFDFRGSINIKKNIK